MPYTEDYTGEPSFWGDNSITNHDAETGDTTGWTASSASVVATGYNASPYCFSIAEGGSLSQTVTPSAGAKKYNVGAYYLPEFPQEVDTEREAKFKFSLELNYSDNTKDVHISPCEIEEI